MARSIGLKLYNLASRAPAQAVEPRASRPPGRLVWLHAPRPQAARSMLDLARRLVEEDGVPVLFTSPDPAPPHDGVLTQAPPPDLPGPVTAFLDHWRPEVAVMSDGELRPALLAECADRRLPVLLADAREPYLPRGREGWYPGLIRRTLAGVSTVMAVDDAAARSFLRSGAGNVRVTGRMEEESAALPCAEAERVVLARLMATRPIWLAVDIPAEEEAAVIAAHRAALLLMHRALLICVPRDPARGAALAAAMGAEGWTVARRSQEEEPDAETEVFLADAGGEYGLWYRLAPITYLGGSLLGAGSERDPLEPAALGSAVVCGPRPGRFAPAFERLGQARALRRIGAAADLGEAVADLMSPDRAARLAQAAWAAGSDGAEATERVLAEIRRLMDGG